MESPLVSAALEKINPSKGYELLKATIVHNPDGSQTVRLLLNYGIGGVKVYEVAVDQLAVDSGQLPATPEPEPEPEEAEVVEVEDLSPLPPLPFREGGEKAAPVKKAGSGASRKAVGGKK